MFISPSIASADVCNIQREVEFAEQYFSHIHLDLEGLAVDDVFIHTDHLENPKQVIAAFQKKGFHTGLGVSNRDLDRDLTALLDQVDSVLVLSAFIEDPLQRYSETMDQFIRDLAGKGRWQVWVDGGVTRERLPYLKNEGIYAAVMGRAIFQDRETVTKSPLV